MINSPSSAPLMKKIQNYVFKFSDMLGQGNFSKVYKGSHQLTNQIVAIKVIELNSLKSPKLEELLFSQIEILKKLNHPNILRCYQVFSSNRNCYIITQLCNEGDLETKLRAKHHFTQNQAEKYIVDILKGLLYLSQNNIIHRDLKVANIFLSNGTAKIADFGFSKLTSINFRDINIGSPIYMAPEGFIHNIYGPKTDVWSFGIFIYELLHGRTPYSHCQNEIELQKQIMIPITYSSLKSDLSFQIKDIILKCLEINQQKRISIENLGQLAHMKKMMKNQQTLNIGYHRLNKSPSKNYQKQINENEGEKRTLRKQEHFSIQKRMPIKSFQDNYFNISPQLMINSKNAPLKYALSDKKPENTHMNSKNQTSQRFHQTYQQNRYIRPFSAQKNSQKTHFHPNNNNIYINKHHTNIPRNNTQTQNGHFSLRNQTDYIQQIKPLSVQSRVLRVFPGILSFKQSVNSLHYCRLIYKYLVSLRENMKQWEIQSNNLSQGRAILSSWMFKILQQMNKKIMNKQVLYQSDPDGKKQSKLEEVTSEYFKKYLSDIFRPQTEAQLNFDVVLYQISEHLKFFNNSLQKSYLNNTYIQQAYFLLVMKDATKVLKRCSASIKFHEWEEYKEIEDFLSKNKNVLTYQAYLALQTRLASK